MENVYNHLQARHVNFALHRPFVDEVGGVAVFFLYNLSGQLVGYQQYRPSADKKAHNHPKEGRYYTYRQKTTLGVFGLESLHLTPNVVFLTEGVFDAARLTSRGVSALAALSNDPAPDLKNWLQCLNRRVVVVCDNDAAGKKLAKFGDDVVFTNEHDLGDSPESFVDELLYKFVK